jgi:hypothetical protein
MQRPDTLVELTERAAPRPIVLRCPRVLRIQPRPPDPPTITARQRSNAMIGRAAQPTGRTGAHSTRARNDMTRRAPRNDRMR